ncbi:hypothetical protein A3Q56_05724 [Intoshia linei]|uniref:Rab-GAP TBC domain-containing protein n=1 Tax=Intoshia linei TaxID=1819745 RepID=A0A177AX27_9BILA|nr:hypothetical protein A3Q56_05724 [Intoshia linei]
MTRNTRIYENILKKAKEETNETIIKQIHSDVPRVLTQHPFFGLASKYHISLFNIVLAYAHLDSRVAYCQGMCTVAAILLLHLKEETAFWSFASLMLKKRYQLQGYYYEGFPKISSLAIVVLKNVKILDVKLHNHLIILNEGILEMLLVRFTFTLFEGTLPNNILLKVWDIYLFYGEIAIVYVCTLLFTFHKEKLMQLSFDGFIQFFNNMKNEKIDVQSFFYQLKSMFADKKNLVKELDCKFKPNKLHTLCNNFKIKNGICGYNEKYSSSKIINAKNKDISKSYSNTESDLFSDSISDPYISVSSSLSDSSDYEIVYNKKSDV